MMVPRIVTRICTDWSAQRVASLADANVSSRSLGLYAVYFHRFACVCVHFCLPR
jgi:hypothetical protein